MSRPQISLVIPTLNEAENLPILVPQIAAALEGREYEILIVDDNSKDQTPAVCAELALTYPLHLIVRTQPKDGLGGAVLHGFKEARGDILVVMDADLQHPPQKLPELVAPLERRDADFVLGSRFAEGASIGTKWSTFRRLNSYVATLMARPICGPALDPMSGFLALRRETYERAQRLTPLGYKIGLELMCKCRVKHVREVPIHFAERTRGDSKLSMREQLRYLEHLSRLYDFCFPRLSPIVKFLVVTTLSWLVGLGVYQGALHLSVNRVLAPVLGYVAALLVTALFHRRYIRTQREFLIAQRPWAEFGVLAAAELTTCAVVAAWLLYRFADVTSPEVFVLSFGAATVVRYVLRKELMQDIRGLRRDLREIELAPLYPNEVRPAEPGPQSQTTSQRNGLVNTV